MQAAPAADDKDAFSCKQLLMACVTAPVAEWALKSTTVLSIIGGFDKAVSIIQDHM
jgi:hypothetical protein